MSSLCYTAVLEEVEREKREEEMEAAARRGPEGGKKMKEEGMMDRRLDKEDKKFEEVQRSLDKQRRMLRAVSLLQQRLLDATSLFQTHPFHVYLYIHITDGCLRQDITSMFFYHWPTSVPFG